MNIFSILSSAFSFRFPSFRFSGGMASKIGELTGRKGISLKPVKPSYIINFGKQVLHSLKAIQSFYRTQLKGVFEANKYNPIRFFAAVSVAIEESASYIGFQLAAFLFSRNTESPSSQNSSTTPDHSLSHGKQHYHPMKVYTVFSSAVSRANDDACTLKQSGMVSDLKTAGATLSAMKVADELECLIAERSQSSPMPSAPPCPDDSMYYSSVSPLPSAPPCPNEDMYYAAPASFLNSAVTSFSDINTECPITFEKFDWDTFVFTQHDKTSDGKVCRVYLKSAIERWVEEHGTHPVVRNQEITVNDFQNVKDHQSLVLDSFESTSPFEPAYYQQSEQVSSFFDQVSLDLSQDKLTTLSQQINDLLNVITDDFVPATQRLTSVSDSISDSYQSMLKKHLPVDDKETFSSVFNTVLEKELLTVEMLNSMRVERVLHKKIMDAYALPEHVTDSYHKLLELREEAEFIVAQFNSIQTFLEEADIYSQLSLLRSDLEMLKVDSNGPKSERFSTILQTVDSVSQNLVKITSFMNDFEDQDLENIQSYFSKPSDVVRDMLLNLFAVMSVHNDGEIDSYRL